MLIKTEKEALELAKELWKFLLETGATKTDFNHSIQAFYLSGCPLCHYYIFQNEKSSFKRKSYTKHNYSSGCEDCCLFSPSLCSFAYYKSAYHKWVIADYSEERKQYALIIYKAITEKLENLK